jgi:hypothetical protein
LGGNDASIFDLETGHRSALVLEEFKHPVQVHPLERAEHLRWSADEFALTACHLDRLILYAASSAPTPELSMCVTWAKFTTYFCPAVQESLNPLTKMLRVVVRKATPQVENGDVVHLSDTKFRS